MGFKFDFTVAQAVNEKIVELSSKIEDETSNINDNFRALGNTFKDQAYEEFQADINAANRSIAVVCDDFKLIGKKMNEYAEKMRELL